MGRFRTRDYYNAGDRILCPHCGNKGRLRIGDFKVLDKRSGGLFSEHEVIYDLWEDFHAGEYSTEWDGCYKQAPAYCRNCGRKVDEYFVAATYPEMRKYYDYCDDQKILHHYPGCYEHQYGYRGQIYSYVELMRLWGK